MNEKYEKIMEKKIASPVELLCKGFPKEYALFVNYTRELKFDEKPDYGYLKRLLRTIIDKEKFEIDYMYDWAVKKKSSHQKDSKDSKDNNNNNNIDNKEDNEYNENKDIKDIKE